MGVVWPWFPTYGVNIGISYVSTLAAGFTAASFLIISSTTSMASVTEINSIANSLVYLEASLVKISLCRTRSFSLALLKSPDFDFDFACAIFHPRIGTDGEPTMLRPCCMERLERLVILHR